MFFFYLSVLVGTGLVILGALTALVSNVQGRARTGAHRDNA